MTVLENIDIDILENNDISTDIDKEILENVDTNKGIKKNQY